MRYDDILVIKNSKALKDLASKTAVTLSHTFADNIARDAYFVANPTELVENVFIKVGAGYQQYVNSTWESSTAVVADLTGIESELDTLTTDLSTHKLDYEELVVEIDGKIDKVQEEWLNPTLLNGWTASYPVSYFKDSLGMVHFRGGINPASKVSNSFLILPAGYRPSKKYIL